MGSWTDSSRPPTGDGTRAMLPDEAAPLLAAPAPRLTRPTYRRFATLPTAAILARGRRTAANLLPTPGALAPGYRAADRRAPSRAPWSGLRLGRAPAGSIPHHLRPTDPVVPVGDGTADGHEGKHVHGEARHRDPVRSSHAHTARRYGHRRVAPAVLVRFPFAGRPRAPPVPVDPYRSGEDGRRRGRPHRTPARP